MGEHKSWLKKIKPIPNVIETEWQGAAIVKSYMHKNGDRETITYTAQCEIEDKCIYIRTKSSIITSTQRLAGAIQRAFE